MSTMFDILKSAPSHYSPILQNNYSDFTSTEEKALYSEKDMRENICNIDQLPLESSLKATIKNQALSVAALVEGKYLQKKARPFSGYNLANNVSTLAKKIPNLGEQELFREELTPAYGTGFLVGKRWILTAGHCVCDRATHQPDPYKIETTHIIFNLCMLNSSSCKTTFAENEVYRIKKVVAFVYLKEDHPRFPEDWALIKLDRCVEGRDPLKLCFEKLEENHKQKRIYTLGHPKGLPLKFARCGLIQDISHSQTIRHTLDIFAGNSGSPTFYEKSREVVAIVIRGPIIEYRKVQNYKGTGLERSEAVIYTQDSPTISQKLSTLRFVKDYLEAKQGNIAAIKHIAVEYFLGSELVSKNQNKAFKLMQRLSDSRNQNGNKALDAEIDYYLGYFYLNSEGAQKNVDKALKHLHKAADDLKDGQASLLLGWFYLFGDNKFRDISKGLLYYQKSASINHPSSLEALAVVGKLYYSNDYGIPTDHKKAYQFLQQAADQGHTSSQVWFGYLLLSNKSERQGLEYARKAADKDHAGACALVGITLVSTLDLELHNSKAGLSYLYKARNLANKTTEAPLLKLIEESIKAAEAEANGFCQLV